MAKRKITKLTDSQWAEIYAYRDDALRAALTTEPADRATTERLIAAFYARIGKPKPAFVWLDGPASCLLVWNLLQRLLEKAPRSGVGAQLGDHLRAQLGDQLGVQLWDQLGVQLGVQLGDQLRVQLWDQLGVQLRAQLGDQLRAQLWDQLRAQLGARLRDQLGVQLWDQLGVQLRAQLWDQRGVQLRDQLKAQLWDRLGVQLRDQLWDQLRAQLRDQLKAQLGDQLRWPAYFAGGEWQYWVAYYIGCERAGVKFTAETRELLGQWDELQRACGWWFPFDEIVFCAERHTRVAFDERRRLHCETGPAIECRDGVKVYAWHGTRIPAEWIEKRAELDPSTALTWENVEQRRAVAEIIGWRRVLERVGAKEIDRDKDPEIGTLLECDLPGSEGSRFLRVRCGTGRDFVLPVPREMTTALQAQEWMWQLEPGEYAPEVRT